MRNASIVTLTPLFSFSLLSWTRSASSSVISASSWFVTCGIITQLRARFAPEIFLIRDSGFDSTGPNLAKSICGHANRLSWPPPVMAPAAGAAAAPLITCLTKLRTSSCRMRFFGPLPLTRARSTPSSRAKARTDGDACAALNVATSTGAAVGWEGAREGSSARGREGVDPSPAASRLPLPLAGEGWGEGAPLASSVAIGEPWLTLSPTFTRTSLTVPAAGDGTSIVALSDSSVTSGSSAFTMSPGLTNTSITGTSLKSPMSGTFTSIALIAASSYGPRRRLLGVELVSRERLAHFRRWHRAVVGERLQRRDRDPVAVDLEEVTQMLARVRAAET